MKSRTPPPVKLLVVDDREENRVSLAALLRRDGVEVLLARSGDEALEHLLAHDVALALLDVQMPDMDGFALAELMRGAQRTRHVPIIFVTASPEEQHRVFRGYDAGAVDFLFKPVDPRVLRHKVEVFVRLYRQREEIAETLRFNELFVAAVGHDLKNPLHAIVLASQLLGRSADEETRRTAERLRSSSRRMQAIIDDLFDLARARQSGGIPIEPAAAELGLVVQKVLAEFAATNPDRTVSLADDSAPHGTKGHWDAGRLAQIVTNLVGNALRHGTAGTPVTLRITADDATVRLAVHNRGVIAEDARGTLFDPFRSTRSGSPEGLGLGLFIVHQLVEAHGGEIDYASSEAEGTTFTVTLCRTPPAPRELASSNGDSWGGPPESAGLHTSRSRARGT